MRWINIAVVIALAAAMLVFAFQNLQIASVSFLNFRFSAPMALLAIGIYALGMVTGGGLVSLARWALSGAKGIAS
jgi:uncharacterized integral membrane protein